MGIDLAKDVVTSSVQIATFEMDYNMTFCCPVCGKPIVGTDCAVVDQKDYCEHLIAITDDEWGAMGKYEKELNEKFNAAYEADDNGISWKEYFTEHFDNDAAELMGWTAESGMIIIFEIMLMTGCIPHLEPHYFVFCWPYIEWPTQQPKGGQA
jgi:hypothetical protein